MNAPPTGLVTPPAMVSPRPIQTPKSMSADENWKIVGSPPRRPLLSPPEERPRFLDDPENDARSSDNEPSDSTPVTPQQTSLRQLTGHGLQSGGFGSPTSPSSHHPLGFNDLSPLSRSSLDFASAGLGHPLSASNIEIRTGTGLAGHSLASLATATTAALDSQRGLGTSPWQGGLSSSWASSSIWNERSTASSNGIGNLSLGPDDSRRFSAIPTATTSPLLMDPLGTPGAYRSQRSFSFSAGQGNEPLNYTNGFDVVSALDREEDALPLPHSFRQSLSPTLEEEPEDYAALEPRAIRSRSLSYSAVYANSHSNNHNNHNNSNQGGQLFNGPSNGSNGLYGSYGQVHMSSNSNGSSNGNGSSSHHHHQKSFSQTLDYSPQDISGSFARKASLPSQSLGQFRPSGDYTSFVSWQETHYSQPTEKLSTSHRRSITSTSGYISPIWETGQGSSAYAPAPLPDRDQFERQQRAATRRFSVAPSSGFQHYDQFLENDNAGSVTATSYQQSQLENSSILAAQRRHSVAGSTGSYLRPTATPFSLSESLESLHVDDGPYEDNASPWGNVMSEEYEHEAFQDSTAGLGKGLSLGQLPHHGSLFVVEFKAGRTDLFYVTEGSTMVVRKGDLVIVEADRGKDLGKVTNDSITPQQIQALRAQQNEAAAAQQDGHRAVKEIHPKRIFRLAQPAEISMLVSKNQDEVKARSMCQLKVRQKRLPMEVVDAEYQWDRRKLTFYFIADRRIDFRELVRELFKTYKTRIWMYAVNPILSATTGAMPSTSSPEIPQHSLSPAPSYPTLNSSHNSREHHRSYSTSPPPPPQMLSYHQQQHSQQSPQQLLHSPVQTQGQSHGSVSSHLGHFQPSLQQQQQQRHSYGQ